MEIFIVIVILSAGVYVIKYINSLKKEVKDLNDELDVSLYNCAKLYYDNSELEKQMDALKKERHQLNKKLAEYENKIKKITNFFNN